MPTQQRGGGSKGPFTEPTYNKSQTQTVKAMGGSATFGEATANPARKNGGNKPSMRPLSYSNNTRHV